MDLIKADVECILNVLEAIEFSAESWNSIGGVFIRFFWIENEIIEAPHIANLRAQMIIERPCSPFSKTSAVWLI